ncbi:MAG TPA: aromatic amino acid ammonia-lyase [Patescibacteria group bacterium]
MKRVIVKINKKYTIEDICLIAKNKADIIVEKSVLESIDKNFQEVKNLFNKNVYGLTTGVGDLSVEKPNISVDTFQKNILLSHAVGTGNYLPKEVIRSAIFSRLIVLSRAMSGVSAELLIFLEDLLNKDVIPLVPEYGSIGASDLTILAGIFVVLCNKGKVLYKGEILPPFEAFKKAKIKYPKKLQTREGLALINGNNAAIGLSCLMIDKLDNFIQQSLETAAFSLEGRGSTYSVYNKINQDTKPFLGQKKAADILEKLLQNSQQIFTTYENKSAVFLQDPPSFKTIAQIFGNAYDILSYAKNVVETELNSVIDNPLFIANKKDVEIVSSGNYICVQLATVFDLISLCLSSIAATSVARMKILTNKNFNEGLPAYLIMDNANNSGFMILVYTVESLLSEIKTLLYPKSNFDISVANGWEDVSTNAMSAVKNTQRVLDLTKKITFIEKTIALQALSLRKEKRPTLKLSKNYEKELKNICLKMPISTDKEIYELEREIESI